MKSLPLDLGQVKMKGKLTRLLSCGCCVAQNLKWKVRWNQALKEIRDR